MKTSIFKNKELSNRFEKEGYVVFPFFCEEEIEQLKKIYLDINQSEDLVFKSSSYIDNIDLKQTVNAKVELIFKDKIDNLFKDYKSLGTSYLTKQNGMNSHMPIHQDWTVVDETKYSSITCWIPLIDTTNLNGAMQVIEGSHLFSQALRGPSLPISFSDIDLSAYLKTIPLKAGEGIIFNHALIHASHSNHSNKERVAVTYGLTNKEAQLLMYYSNNDRVEEWEMPDTMFLEYPKVRFEPKLGNLKRAFEYKTPKLELQDVKQKRIEQRKTNTMVPLFINNEHQEFFEKNGYVLVPALNQEDISRLIELYSELGLKDEKGYGFHVGMDNKDKSLVDKMVSTIKGIALPKIQEYLHDTQVFTASFVIKEPNPTGVVPPHQDWSFVENEVDHCSVTCWIPLQDVNMDNGCMGVIKGSNHFFESHRPSPSPQVETPLKKHMFTIFPFLELIEMKAGEALIFNNKTIHASPPNITNQTRLAVGLGFTQKEAEIRHYYLKPGTQDTLLKYKITPDFFLKYDNAQLSELYDKGEVLNGVGEPEEIPYIFEDLDAPEFTKLIQESGNQYNSVLVNRMSQLFSSHANVEEQNNNEEEQEHELVYQEVISAEPFWKVYTPINIIREIKHRLSNN
jgi:ectoine hydroxylase-related dioxygenase (phytanoyl-CoA dioxygenase family)